MAGGTFRLADIRHLVDTISGRVQFPINEAAALETAFGGSEATVALGAEQHKASEVRQIPADFFPIDSADDLFTKLAHLRSADGDQPEDLGPGERHDSLPPGVEAPPRREVSPDEIRRGSNVPSVWVR